jgi:hypothetical protein
MHDLKWSGSEKKVARSAFDAAFNTVLSGIMADFKARAAAAAAPSDMWKVKDYLRKRRRHVDDLFDFRYSQLCFVFAQLIVLGYLDEKELAGLSDETLQIIRRARDLMRQR